MQGTMQFGRPPGSSQSDTFCAPCPHSTWRCRRQTCGNIPRKKQPPRTRNLAEPCAFVCYVQASHPAYCPGGFCYSLQLTRRRLKRPTLCASSRDATLMTDRLLLKRARLWPPFRSG
ncbi:hypothetical protein B0I35DRAFT_416608 [Stachybotrys elegans]|uniref:Uncharacterized protein n=1 Tax=Stachybotrys elegans TaxID=80388 RepID=A0A8K0WX51_9HYPO|nr:hypothetical protein B0I35DRAFT_416608 [Stachybotrys elegans]